MSISISFNEWAKIFYVLTLLWLVACLWRGHRYGHINLWDCVKTSARGNEYTDPKKLAYSGAFAVMSVAFAYLTVVDKLTEWFCALFVTAFVVGKWLGDREQRLARTEPSKDQRKKEDD